MTEARRSSRRTVLKGAAWGAPAIVVVSAAPAMAASGPAVVTTAISGSVTGTTLSVSVVLTNANTIASGLTNVTVTVTPTAVTGGSITGTNASVAGTSTAGWTGGTGTAGTGGARSFAFSNATGVPGAATPTGTASSTLNFTVAYLGGLQTGGSLLANVTVDAPGATAAGGPGTY